MRSFSPRQIAMLAYLPFVGFLIAFSINTEMKSPFATWHIKNMFGLFIMFFVALVVQSQIDPLAGDILWFITLILWIFSFVRAAQRKETAIPWLSSKFQTWFSFLN
ncbi:MAG TPA: hypothetical protein VFF21_02005 [Flavobacteriaceae bacterium]|nr:hypothetical protein [Flavobacteriaceae bacterium]